jgi:hypothetical protein
MIREANLTAEMVADCGLPVVDGEDKSENNPLYRATSKLFKEGKPIKRLSKCFFADDSGLLRWIGVFVQSAGDRILFFPGISDELTNIKGIRDTKILWEESFDLELIIGGKPI